MEVGQMNAGPLLWNPTVQSGCMLKMNAESACTFKRRSVHRSVIRKRSPNSPSSSHGGAAGSPLDDAACTLRQRTAVHCTQSIHTVDPHSRSSTLASTEQSGTHTEWNPHKHRCSGSAASNIRRPHTIEGRRKFFEPEQFRKRRSFAVSSSKCM